MLDKLIEDLRAQIQRLTEMLESKRISVSEWQESMEEIITRYHLAAYMAGNESVDVDKRKVSDLLTFQFSFLVDFAALIESASEFAQGWISRAKSYADAIKVAYWEGRTRGIPLPAMPAEGTQCMNNCGCHWEITTLSGSGNYDCYWRRGKDDSCQTCIERESRWSPVRIRDGVMQ